MSDSYRALVVDDDPIARKTVMMALGQEEFRCDTAIDGEDALRQLANCTYDLVVTDLRMPKKHGHALSVELLARTPRPVIVVHSSVDDPRLAKDLMMRGVDDIIYKPTNYATFAAKIRGLVRHRRAQDQVGAEVAPAAKAVGPTQHSSGGSSEFPETDGLVPLSDIENKISLVSRILPVSKTALDVFALTRTECDANKLAAMIQLDPALMVEVLSIANSTFYNPSRHPITELEKAVVRIGQQRIGELSLAAATLSTLTDRKIGWMDMQTVWRQSVAAGVAVEQLVAQGRHARFGNNLALIAIMHALGRVVLASLYPAHYRRLLEQRTDEPLSELEKTVFPESHTRVMARLLAVWNLPDEICQPMRYLLDSYAALSRLPEPLRSKVELVKLSAFVGQIAMGAWHAWDSVELPTADLLKRMRIHDLRQVLENTRQDTQAIIAYKIKADARPHSVLESKPAPAPQRIWYENASSLPFDFIAELARQMNFEPFSQPPQQDAPAAIVMNRVGTPPQMALPVLPGRAAPLLVVSDHETPPDCQPPCRHLPLPAAYDQLRTLFQRAATTENTARGERSGEA